MRKIQLSGMQQTLIEVCQYLPGWRVEDNSNEDRNKFNWLRNDAYHLQIAVMNYWEEGVNFHVLFGFSSLYPRLKSNAFDGVRCRIGGDVSPHEMAERLKRDFFSKIDEIIARGRED